MKQKVGAILDHQAQVVKRQMVGAAVLTSGLLVSEVLLGLWPQVPHWRLSCCERCSLTLSSSR